jgi:NAD(P)-dependent dehydrogenase (short-subunit alcohol dehydrogenase family)
MTRTLLVTGGSRGIGRATALAAAAAGWSVGVGYRADEQAAREVVAAIEEGGGRAVAVRGDVSVEADVLALYAAVEEALGPLDGVVVNAGIARSPSDFVEAEAAQMRRILEVNVLGALLCAREAARRLAQSRGGRGGSVVLVSSAAARLGSPHEYVDYAASKGAVETLGVGLAKELAHDGVRVNVVRPGIIETDIHAAGGDPDRAARLTPSIPLRRPGTADEVAAAILWLLGDASSYTTGSVVEVTGGR